MYIFAMYLTYCETVLPNKNAERHSHLNSHLAGNHVLDLEDLDL